MHEPARKVVPCLAMDEHLTYVKKIANLRLARLGKEPTTILYLDLRPTATGDLQKGTGTACREEGSRSCRYVSGNRH